MYPEPRVTQFISKEFSPVRLHVVHPQQPAEVRYGEHRAHAVPALDHAGRSFALHLARKALARLRTWRPGLVVWGVSATMGNLDLARQVLLGDTPGVLVEGDTKKQIVVDSLIPKDVARFPWGGHLGLQMLKPVIDEIEHYDATLVFTNTRSQSEIWYQNLLAERPDWAGLIALHHGSLEREVREWVEVGLRCERLRAVVAATAVASSCEPSIWMAFSSATCQWIPRALPLPSSTS